ncbi:MAG TPA: hypothetical protein VH877_17975 [Polyangia bacterium]|jgi:hypothetical protein|nr:hypothetical protein [Polyangia bacterium]
MSMFPVQGPWTATSSSWRAACRSLVAGRRLLLLGGVGLGVLWLLPGCGRGRPDPLTAVEHEIEADRRRARGAKAEGAVRLAETALPVASGSEAAKTSGAIPPGDLAAGRAEHEAAIAQKHERAARQIRTEAALACSRVPPAERSSCPLPESSRIEEIPGGVRIVSPQPQAAELLRGQIGCALAEARVDHPGDERTCPLYVPGAAPHVIDRPEGAAIDITTDRASFVNELRRRARRRFGASTGGPQTVPPAAPAP